MTCLCGSAWYPGTVTKVGPGEKPKHMHVHFKDGDKKKILLEDTDSWAYQSEDPGLFV